MTLQPIRAYRRKLHLTSGILLDNPVLTMAMGIPFIVIASTSLKNGLLMSLIVLVADVTAFLAARAAGEKASRFVRLPVCCFVSVVCITLAFHTTNILPIRMDELGVYVPLAAVNRIVLENIRGRNVRAPFMKALGKCVRMSLGFAFVMIIVSIIREILGNGTVWDISVHSSSLFVSGAALPCFGFILLGMFAALGRQLDRAIIARFLKNSDTRAEGKEETA